MPQPEHLQLAQQIAGLFSALPQVRAVALGGSRGRHPVVDPASDLDLYVYTQSAVPLSERQAIVTASGGASRANLGLEYWGPGDEWYHAPTGLEIDIVYFDCVWMEQQLAAVLELGQASQGYTTCFWHTVAHSISLYDPHAWFSGLQQRCQVKYPETLRQNIVTLNYPLLRIIIPSYYRQLEKARERRDLVSVNHRLAALLACYFDILFAVNRQTHPGEKRLVEYAQEHCSSLPKNFARDLASVLLTSSSDPGSLLNHLGDLLDHLDQWLVEEGFTP